MTHNGPGDIQTHVPILPLLVVHSRICAAGSHTVVNEKKFIGFPVKVRAAGTHKILTVSGLNFDIKHFWVEEQLVNYLDFCLYTFYFTDTIVLKEDPQTQALPHFAADGLPHLICMEHEREATSEEACDRMHSSVHYP